MITSLYQKHRSFILYALIGLCGVTLDYIVFLVLFNAFGVNAALATAISVVCGITNNFALNAIFNFKKRDHIFVRYLLFLAVGMFGLVLSIAIIALGSQAGLDPNISKLLSIPFIVVLQYFLNKHISFQDSPEKFTKYLTTKKGSDHEK
ncbi:MAG TPA: GtrA family protein [Candidatus Saccharimonadales bacterium]